MGIEVKKLFLLTDNQRELLNRCQIVLDAYNVAVHINCYGCVISNPIALDVEHDERGEMVCIGMYNAKTKEAHIYTEVTPLLKYVVENAEIITHNGVGDFECLRIWGIDVKPERLVWDTMLIGHILDSSLKAYGLKDMAKRELGIEYPDYDEIVGKDRYRTTKKTGRVQTESKVTLDKQPIELVAAYNACDTLVTSLIKQKQGNPRICGFLDKRSSEQVYFEGLERPIAGILSQMESRGVRVDLQYLEGLKRELEAQKAPIEADIKNELGDINLNSPKQLLEALHGKEIYPEFKGKPSTDKRAFSKFNDNHIIQLLLSYSELDTLLSSFVYPYLERGQEVVHPFFNQCGTRTGRLSCSNPNLLQIPKRTQNGQLVRRMFIPREGFTFGDCDFGQIEPRLLAHLSKDPVMCGMFNQGIDFHTFTAERLGIERGRAKVLNLSVGYRATFKSVSQQLKCTEKEAQNEIDKWWSLFPHLHRWQDKLIYDSKRSGFCTTLLGRRIKIDGLTDGNTWKRQASERQLINNITQGSAAEVMKKAMIRIWEYSPTVGQKLLVQVYDELLFEETTTMIDQTLNFVKLCMEKAVELDVPLVVDAKSGPNWADCKGD